MLLTQIQQPMAVPPHLQVLLPHVLCFAIQQTGNESKQPKEWMEEIESLYNMEDLRKQQIHNISDLEKDLQRSRKKSKDLTKRNSELQTRLVSATDVNQKLQGQLLQYSNLTSRNQQLEDQLYELQRNLSTSSVQLVKLLLPLEEEKGKCQSALEDFKQQVINLTEEVNSKQELLDFMTEDIERLLQKSARSGEAKLVHLLLKYGVNVSAKGWNGYTALHWAARRGDMEVAKALLDAGALLNVGDNNNNTPLHRATEFDHLGLCQLLLDRGAQVNARTKYDNTPLHVAAQEGHFSIVQLLVQRGADISAENRWKKSPRDDAVSKGHQEVADWLSSQ